MSILLAITYYLIIAYVIAEVSFAAIYVFVFVVILNSTSLCMLSIGANYLRFGAQGTLGQCLRFVQKYHKS